MRQRNLALSFAAALGLWTASAAPVAVTYDENNEISPAAAKTTISNACSAVVQVNLASARAEILAEVASVAGDTLDEANELLNSHSDYVLLDLFAVGVEDATAQGPTATEGRIDIVGVNVDRMSTPGSTLVTVTWQYTTGSFTAPKILASATVTNGSVYASLPQTEPEQISWGTNSAYRATATIDNATFGESAFLKIEATPDAPLDDGQVFDVFSDGTDYTIDLVPSRRYRIRIISGRITTIQLVEDSP